MTIDTACSSSLVAADAACKALYNHDCQLAVVTAINIVLSMKGFISTCAFGGLSRRGRCATFSDEADGFLLAEGCGAAVLKPLSSALQAKDAVWSVIHGTAVNQD